MLQAWLPENDGVDHLNVYSKGRTELGRWLSHFTRSPFVHPEDGGFESIEGYWYWLGCAHPERDKLRFTWGFEAKRLGRELRSPDWKHSKEFQRKILEANRLKLEAHPRWWRELCDSNLPLAHYYVYGSKVVPVPGVGWILSELERLRRDGVTTPRHVVGEPRGDSDMPNPIPPPPPPPSGGTRRAAIPPPTAGARAPAVHPGGLAAGTQQLAKDPAPPQVAARTGQTLNFSDLPVGFEPRDGDVLVVHYGAVKVPLPSGKFGSIEVGGESYTRQLRAGDDVGEQYEKVYGFLKGRAERAAQEKVKGWYSQFSKSEGGTT